MARVGRARKVFWLKFQDSMHITRGVFVDGRRNNNEGACMKAHEEYPEDDGLTEKPFLRFMHACKQKLLWQHNS